MLVSMIIVFREAMEAGLIVGIVLAATKGVRRRGRWIAGGIGAGAIGAVLVALFAASLSNAFAGAGQEVFSASILLFAVVMLTWHVAWMSHHARSLAQEMRQVGDAVRMGQKSLMALAVVVAVAVLREGAEVALFLFGIVAGSSVSAISLGLGGVAGLALAAALSWLLYRGLVAISLRRLFSVTNGLIALLAAGMAGQAASILHSADLLPGWGEQLWDTSFLLDDQSYAGRALHALVGYTARPSGIQLVAWVGTLVLLGALSHLVGRPQRRGLVTALTALLALVASSGAHAQDAASLTFRNHRLEPSRLEVPAHRKFKLQVQNADDTAEEFESAELNREKIVAPGQSVTVFLGPLEPGEYKVFGDFHQDTAKGLIIAK